jgi:four helix bundle protein
MMGERIRFHTDLEVYQVAFIAAMEIFQVTKSFPKEEIYSLTDQIRRSSRSVCANISEAWRKRRYPGAFINGLNHAEAEAAETQVWLSFSKECAYLVEKQADRLVDAYDPIIGIIVTMIKHPEKWII